MKDKEQAMTMNLADLRADAADRVKVQSVYGKEGLEFKIDPLLLVRIIDFAMAPESADAQHRQELAAYELTVGNLRTELVAEATRTAEEKLRADQMTGQHRMQCNMRQESEDVLDAAKEHIRDLEAQLSAIGAGGVESLRKRECLHQIATVSAALTSKTAQMLYAKAEAEGEAAPDGRMAFIAGVGWAMQELALPAMARECATQATDWDASQILQPGWDHVQQAFCDGAREARANPEVMEADFWRAAEGYTKRVFEEVDPRSEEAMRTESWQAPAQEHATQPAGQGLEVPSDAEAFQHFVSDCDGAGIQYDSASYEAGFRTGRSIKDGQA